MKSSPKEACVNCHFIMKHSNPNKFAITADERDSIRNRDYSWLHDCYALGCYHGIWDEGYNFNIERRNEMIVTTNRKDGCFFFPYKEGMLFPAAEKLQKREPLHMSQKFQKHASSNPWISGSFYLASFLMIMAGILVVSKVVDPFILPIVIIGTLLAVSVVGAFQLRQDQALNQQNFLSLMGLTFKQLPFVREKRDTEGGHP